MIGIGISPLIASVTVSSAPPSPPSAPTLTSVQGVDLLNISATFSPVSGATSYNLYSDGFVVITGYHSNDSYSTDSNIHAYTLTAVNAGGESSQSVPVNGAVQPAPATSVSMNSADDIDVDVSFTASTSPIVSSYTLLFDTNNPPTTDVGTPSSSPFRVTAPTVAPNTTYYAIIVTNDTLSQFTESSPIASVSTPLGSINAPPLTDTAGLVDFGSVSSVSMGGIIVWTIDPNDGSGPQSAGSGNNATFVYTYASNDVYNYVASCTNGSSSPTSGNTATVTGV